MPAGESEETVQDFAAPRFNPDPARPLALLGACPAYGPTPLHRWRRSGASAITVKDETARFGLGAFKALGGAFAVAALIREAHETAGQAPLAPQEMMAEAARATAARLPFVCASAGNHGIAVAAGARLFGARARVHLSATVPEAFAERLRARGAEVVRSGPSYEASIEAAMADADATGAIHLADGSWPNYAHAPSLVMEGYTVIAEELRVAFEATGAWPTHVMLQAGVGGLAAAMAVMIRRNWAHQPEIVVVEPDAAPCLAASHDAGALREVAGPVSTMGRLDCKAPSMLAFEALEAAKVRYLAVPDHAAEDAAAWAARQGCPTTPSGAAELAGLFALEADATITADARPLVILSEGPEG